MVRHYDPLADLAPLLVSVLNMRNDAGVYASAIARELGLYIEDDEATVLARLREAVAAQASVAAEPKAAPHDDGTSYCTSLPEHDHDQAGEACPVYRPGENGFRWQCMLSMAHNNPDQDPDYDPQRTVHRDQFGTEFRVARCQDPAAHGMPHCWCTVPGHHRPLEPEPPAAPVYLLGCGHQFSDGDVHATGDAVDCRGCGATVAVMAIPLSAPATEPAGPEATS